MLSKNQFKQNNSYHIYACTSLKEKKREEKGMWLFQGPRDVINHSPIVTTFIAMTEV